MKDLQAAIYRQVDESWDQFHVDIEDNLNRETERQFDSLFNAIKAVMDKICRDAGGTVPATIRKIDHALEGVAVPNVVISKMLSVCKNQFYLKKNSKSFLQTTLSNDKAIQEILETVTENERPFPW